MDRMDLADKLFSRLERIEDKLSLLEEYGRPDDHATPPPKRTDGLQIEVRIRCNVIQMGDIDNVSQEFKAHLYVSAMYLEPGLRGIHSEEEVDWTKQWDPRLAFINSTGMETFIKKVYIRDYDYEADAPIVNKTYRIVGTFKEKLELHDFPFDCQELNVTLMSDWPSRDIRLVKDMGIKDSLNINNFAASQTWDLKPFILGRPLEVTEEAGSHRKYPYYQITCYVTRYVGFYFWNIALVMMVIMGLTFASYAVPPTETGDRIAVSVTLLLTSVAFKFIVSQNLPTISYLTLLDGYVLMCMIFQVLITIQNALSSIWSDVSQTEAAKLFDTISACIIVGMIILFHIILGIIIGIKVRRRNKLLRESKTKYLDLCAVINEEFQKRKKNNNKITPSPQKEPSKNFPMDTIDKPHTRPNMLEPVQR